MNGFTDKPLSHPDEDVFNVKQYISGLKDFILECYTPMTIAIQGDWGSGKTSMMNMIRNELKKKVIAIEFNTWQYSQFNMGDALAVSFLSHLVEALAVEGNEKGSNVKKLLRIIAKFAKTAAVIAAENIAGERAAGAVEKSVDSSAEQETMDMPQAISELKKQFQEAVEAKIASKGGDVDRLVIFVDDLDRLHPGKAVELLEVLKLFLDCEKCVFVLAIDYGVVSQGVKQKYGELIGEEKGRSFFDKIIQVPFKMPVAQYDIKGYVTKTLEDLGVSISDAEAESYKNLIQCSVGCNPRAMKRLFNAFLLLNKIAVNGTDMDDKNRKMLFAILCLQLSFENVYNYIVQHTDECYNNRFLEKLANPDTYRQDDDAERLARELHLQTDADIVNVVEFMTAFNNALDQDGNGELAKGELESFVQILRFSTITASASSATATESSLESHYRYYNRDIIKDVLDEIQGSHSAGEYKIYQTRTNNNPQWKRYFACGWKPIVTDFGNVNLEFKIETDLQKKESKLSLWVHATDKADRCKFVEKTKEWYKEQNHGFEYLEKHCGYWLNNKTVNADSRDEIIQYFTQIVPLVAEDLEKALLT